MLPVTRDKRVQSTRMPKVVHVHTYVRVYVCTYGQTECVGMGF